MVARQTLAGVAAAVLLAGCGGYADTAVPSPDEVAAPSLPEPAAPQTCGDPTRSYAPDGSVSELRPDAVDQLRNRDRLVVGVSADSYLLGSNNPFTGQIEGFDIDLAEAVADAIWGDAQGHVQLRVITAADRIPLLQSGDLDIVARNMTINCERWEQIAFSAEYYRAGQKVLVRKDLAEEGIDTAAELAGLRVCAPDGTTSLANILAESPDVEAVTAANHTGCLAKLQRGEADAITGDDTVLAGLAAQDPYAVVPEQDAFTDEPYGIAVNQDNEDLVRFINAVLEEMRADGTWQDSYDRWLRPTLGEGTGQPPPVYGR